MQQPQQPQQRQQQQQLLSSSLRLPLMMNHRWSHSDCPYPPNFFIRFHNQTLVLRVCHDDNTIIKVQHDPDCVPTELSQLLPNHTTMRIACQCHLPTLFCACVAEHTGYPAARLRVQALALPFATVALISSVRGGKGGFGTLLKGQSRQAAPNPTLDFGACRDLHGRRLRSINDEIALRIQREYQQRRAMHMQPSHAHAHAPIQGSGTSNNSDPSNPAAATAAPAAPLDDLITAFRDTPSGIAGWFLQLPAWADTGPRIRKAAQRTLAQQYRTYQRDQNERRKVQAHARAAQQDAVAQHVQHAHTALSHATAHLSNAVQQGLLLQQQQQHSSSSSRHDDNNNHDHHDKNNKKRLYPHDATTITTTDPKELTKQPTLHIIDGSSEESTTREENINTNDFSSPSGPASAFVTLSGDVVVHPEANNHLTGASNFATVGVLLRPHQLHLHLPVPSTLPASPSSLTPPPHPSSYSEEAYDGGHYYYYYFEVVLHQGGHVQIGWLVDPTVLDSEKGDGVGDIPHSWSYTSSYLLSDSSYSSNHNHNHNNSNHSSRAVARKLCCGEENRTSDGAVVVRPSSGSGSGSGSLVDDDGKASALSNDAINHSEEAEVGDENAGIEYGTPWKAGDVVSCLLLWNHTHGKKSIQYFLNGTDLGLAFENIIIHDHDNDNNHQDEEFNDDCVDDSKISNSNPLSLIPAVSLNPGEGITFRLHRSEFQFFDSIRATMTTIKGYHSFSFVPVGECLLDHILEKQVNYYETLDPPAAKKVKPDHPSSNPPTIPSPPPPPPPLPGGASAASSHAPPPPPPHNNINDKIIIRLEDYNSVQALEDLGMDILKRELQLRGLKAGGTLHERAVRLHSVKGLLPSAYPRKSVAATTTTTALYR